MSKVFIKKRRARPFWFGHPWVFSGAIDRTRGKLKDGDVVDVCDFEGRTIGQGFWNGKSQIRVRLTALHGEGPLTDDFLVRRLDAAVALRREVLRLDAVTNAYRVVHSEGDGLPGLIVDKVGDRLVVQLGSLGIARRIDPILDRLEEIYAPSSILERASKVAVEEEGLERDEGVLRGAGAERAADATTAVEVHEHGVRYVCDPGEGQKTGWYADQRDNRRALAPLARDRDVLDAFSYVGGFGLAMAKAGARSVRCVDSSERALAHLALGARANDVESVVTAEQGNVLRVLDHAAKEDASWDVVVLDPPKFVHKRSQLERGLKLYQEVNLKGVNVVRPGGVLVTCSCSQHVQPEHFEEMLGAVAHEAGVRLQEIYSGGQAADHPSVIPMDENRYLKCRAYRVWKGDR